MFFTGAGHAVLRGLRVPHAARAHGHGAETVTQRPEQGVDHPYHNQENRIIIRSLKRLTFRYVPVRVYALGGYSLADAMRALLSPIVSK